MKIAAGIIFFNDKDSLRRCIDSLVMGVDLIFAIDGKFPQYPGTEELSYDGSRELVKQYSDYKVVLVDCPKPEFEKRQHYLKLCSEYGVDVLLIIDSDEYVRSAEGGLTDWQGFRRSLHKVIMERDDGGNKHNVYGINMFDPTCDNSPLAYPRIWYRPEEMEYYAGRHYFFRNKYPVDHPLHKINLPHQAAHNVNLIEGISLAHDHSLRSKHHMSGRHVYQIWLSNYEIHLPPP
jgi:hypothetical protein